MSDRPHFHGEHTSLSTVIDVATQHRVGTVRVLKPVVQDMPLHSAHHHWVL